MPAVPGPDLDSRLLRYRSTPSSEDAARLSADLLEGNRLDDVMEITRAALASRPDDPELLVLSARADFAAGRLNEAQVTLLKAARVAGTRKEPFRWLGEVLLKRGDPARASKVLERAKQIDPTDRTIQTLHQRAERLTRLAERGHEASVVAPLPTGPKAVVEERTVVRTDLAAALAEAETAAEDDEVTRIAAEPKRPPPGRPAPFPARPVPARPAAPMAAPLPAAPKPVAPPKADPFAFPPPAAVPAELKGLGAPSPFEPPTPQVAVPSPPPAPFAPPTPRVAPVVATAAPLAPEPARPFESVSPPPYSQPPEALAIEDFDPTREEDGVVETEADLPVGASAGQSESVDDLLSMLQREGLFEPPTGEAAQWATSKEAKPVERTKVGVWLGAAWVLMLALAGGGYYGWTVYVEQRHAEAVRLVEAARIEALAGDHQRLVDAERHLREARELNPRDPANGTLLLFVHAQRALEDGAFEVGFLAPTLARAERDEADPAYLSAARAVVSLGGGDLTGARTGVDAALAAGPEDPSILYIAGRLEQRLGDDDALTHLEAAIAGEPTLTAAAIALAEARSDEGRQEDAIALLDGVLAREPEHLRALLWKAYLTAGDAEIEPGLAQLTELDPRMEHGAPTDHVLFQLTRAHLLRRRGDHEGAVAAVDAALSAGAEEPRLLALAAHAARAEGRYVQAERAATEAVRRSPANTEFRKLLAAIYLDRRNGESAMRTLGELSAEDPAVLVMTAQAALLVGTVGAAQGASQVIDTWMSAHEGEASVELRALRIRLEVGVAEDPAAAYEAARTLAAENPGDPVAAMAMGEAALRTRHVDQALEALATVVASAPENADGHWLLGRARRMEGDGVGARQSFERAVELRSEHHEARLALGGLLLDLGDYEAADTLYTELARSGASAGGAPLARTGRLGRVEALIGLGRLDDAGVQLEGVRGEDATSPDALMVRARLSVARGQFGEALTTIRPLTEGDSPSVAALALYGEALLGARQAEAAEAALDRALELDDGLPEALVTRAEVAFARDQARDAGELISRAHRSLEHRIRPPALRARLAILEARAQLEDRNAGGAATTLRRAIEMAGCPADAHFFLGRALEDDDEAAALTAFQRYLELAPEGRYAADARRATR
jgi:tetratricopeptide (TPR) repeat protein